MSDNPLNKALEAATEPVLNIVNPPTRSIGRFFGDTLDFWFSNRELKYAKKKIMDEVALRKFREECEAEFAKIPEDELVPPRKALLLPALDAAEYYVEEEELRQMFARLVAATCDMRKASKVHPSFAMIIQQLSPLDVENLLTLYSSPGNYLPVFGYSWRTRNYEAAVPFFLTIKAELGRADLAEALSLNATSINNLCHLGLIVLSFGKDSVLADQYYEIYQTNSFLQLMTDFLGKDINDINDCDMKKGVIDITALGEDFLSICLPNQEALP